MGNKEDQLDSSFEVTYFRGQATVFHTSVKPLEFWEEDIFAAMTDGMEIAADNLKREIRSSNPVLTQIKKAIGKGHPRNKKEDDFLEKRIVDPANEAIERITQVKENLGFVLYRSPRNRFIHYLPVVRENGEIKPLHHYKEYERAFGHPRLAGIAFSAVKTLEWAERFGRHEMDTNVLKSNPRIQNQTDCDLACLKKINKWIGQMDQGFNHLFNLDIEVHDSKSPQKSKTRFDRLSKYHCEGEPPQAPKKYIQ